MMSDILVFLLLALNFQGSDTAMALVTNTSLNENHFLQCDDPIVLTCSIPTYSNTMTWQVNSVITAQCAFGSCTTNLPPPTNHVYAFDQINKKFTITINNTLLADNGTNFVCGDGITSTSLTTIVKVTPDNDEVVVTSMENSTNVNIVVTTGCSDTEDVTITWYYTKDASSSSPSPYTDEHAVTVPLPDTACETGNCGLNGFVKKQSTLNIKKSTSGDLYYFKILIKHPSTSGYFVTTNKSYFIKGTVTTSSTLTAIPITSPTSTTTHLVTPNTTSSTSTSTTSTTTASISTSTTTTTSIKTSARTTNSAVPTQIVTKSEQDDSITVVIVVPSVVGGLFVFGVAVTGALVWKYRKNQNLHNTRSKHHKEGLSKKENKGRHLKRHPEYSEYIPSHHHGFSAKELHGYKMYSGQIEIKRNPLYSHHLDRHMNMSYVTNRAQYHYDQLYNGNQFLVYQMPSARADPLYTGTGPEHRYQYSINPRATTLRTQDNTIVTDYSWNWN